ncbi:O-antigen ligase family protein [Neisseriaceae bacterium TC5R-5]|nr:O-antigen ligase family protein [Neisseriaceae bacterium TC5R-5]
MFIFSLPLMWQSDTQRWQWLLFTAISGVFWLVLLQLIFGMINSPKVLDAPLRFLLAACCLFALSKLSAARLVWACYGCIIGALGVMVWGYVSTHVSAYYWMDGSRAWNGFSNPIAFGCLSLLLGFISLILPIPIACARWKPIIFLLKVFAFVAAMVAAYYSASRAILLLVIPLLFLVILYFSQWRILSAGLSTILGIGLLTLLIMNTDNRVRNRIYEGERDIAVFAHDQNTSMGLRFEMWQVAVQIIADHPLSGVGRYGYQREVRRRIQLQQAPAVIADAWHPHNELLTLGVEMGMPGLLAALALYLVPACLFCSRLRREDPLVRFAATAGAMVVFGHLVVGLMDSYFWIVSQTAFYGVSVVVFAAIILSQENKTV